MELTLTPSSLPGVATVAPVRVARGSIVIGRAPGAGLCLPDPNAVISSHHCTLQQTGSGWMLTDTSTNGTMVNGERVQGQRMLRHGDMLRIGGYEVAVAIGSPAAAAWSRPAATAAPVPAPTRPPAQPGTTSPASGDPVAMLLAAAGLRRDQVQAPDPVVLQAAGTMLKAALAGLIMLGNARDKARRELGLEPIAGSADPLPTAASPEAALARLLSQPGPAAEMIAASFARIEAHQRAGLTAMQGALRASLDHFAPAPILRSAGGKPDAAWKRYEQAFAADDGFIETFARELAQAWSQIADGPKQ